MLQKKLFLLYTKINFSVRFQSYTEVERNLSSTIEGISWYSIPNWWLVLLDGEDIKLSTDCMSCTYSFFTDVEENFVLRSESTCVFEKYDDGTKEKTVCWFSDPIFGTTCFLKILFQRCDMKRLLISSVYIFTLNYYRQNKHRNMSNTEELTRDGKGIFGTSTKSLKH